MQHVPCQQGIEVTWSSSKVQSTSVSHVLVYYSSATCTLSGILNYGTPSQQGVSVYIKEQALVWDFAPGTRASQFTVKLASQKNANAKAKIYRNMHCSLA